MTELMDPLDLDAPDAEAFLAGIQGNIIKGHGRDFTPHVVVRFGDDVAAVRRFLARWAAEHVTTAVAARRATLAWRGSGGYGEPFAMVMVAAEGYRNLGYADRLPVAGPLPGPQDRELFTRGMKHQDDSTREIHDPPVTAWEPCYRDPIHALLLLADDDEQRLLTRLADLRASSAGALVELTTEYGRVLRKDFPRGRRDIEHFGFQDGVSQPLMIKQDAEAEVARRGHDHWDPTAPLGLALAPDPAGGFGSFAAFRKLEQDVAGFRAALAELATNTGRSVDQVGAMAVGRHEDRTPAVLTPTPPPDGDANDFHFGQQDPNGSSCPFHAHIRKTNPRGDTKLDDFERSRRVVRRGITYGLRPDLATAAPRHPPRRASACSSCASRATSTSSRSSRSARTATTSSGPGSARTPSSGRTPIRWPRPGPATEW